MRGFFAIGAEGISKAQNVGTIRRTAHAFGASFFFTIDPGLDVRAVRQTDTSEAWANMPCYDYKSINEPTWPKGARIVGIELTDDAIPMPSFRHPAQAIYIFGPEMGVLSHEIQEKCDFIVQIPTQFCVNVGVACAITLYDRMISMGKHAERPVRPGGPLNEAEIRKTRQAIQRGRFSRNPNAKANGKNSGKD